MTTTADAFDFIIISGGTTGLTVATRLSEDPKAQVLVIEAGSDHTDDPRVTMPAGWTALLSSECDWSFSTVPQVC